MFEKRVIPGKTYCVTAYCPIIVSSVLNNTEVILVDTSEPGQYFFVAPTTTISSSISPNYILEVKGGGAGDSGNSGSGSGVGISFEKVADFDSLPETGKLGTIYLVPTEDTDNQWTEYVYIDGRYEIIGSKDFTGPDLKNYAKLDADNIFTGNTNTFNGTVNATGLNVTDAAISNNLTANSITASSVFATTDATIDGSLIITGELITDGTGKDFQEILDAHIDDNTKHVSAESIQAVVPMAWGTNSGAAASAQTAYGIALGGGATADGGYTTAIGVSANVGYCGTALGCAAKATGTHAIALAGSTSAQGGYSIALGDATSSIKDNAITIGAQFNDTAGSYTCTTEGTGSITIGAGANTLNNGTTESSNSVTIGCKASNTGADSVVIGAQASGTKLGGVAIGSKASAQNGVGIGYNVSSGWGGIAVGANARSSGEFSIAVGKTASAANFSTIAIGNQTGASGYMSAVIGQQASSSGISSVAIGRAAKCADDGVTVLSAVNGYSAVDFKTQVYIAGANTPLATEYYNGEAFMGYTVTDASNNVLACGTRRLSELFPDNSLTQPATLDENGDWVMPKVFRPSDLDMPDIEIKEPEMEEYTPLPVYPIVEPEIEEPIN